MIPEIAYEVPKFVAHFFCGFVANRLKQRFVTLCPDVEISSISNF
jgi:hypothetical protein